MAGVVAQRFVRPICSDTASGRAITDIQPIGTPFGSNCTSMTTFSESPVWTTPVAIGPDVVAPIIHIMKEVSSGDRKVVFDKGLRLALTVEWDGDLCVASDERFGLYGSGQTAAEAISDYSEFFIEFFAELEKTPSTELPPSTRKFKRTLLAFGGLIERD